MSSNSVSDKLKAVLHVDFNLAQHTCPCASSDPVEKALATRHEMVAWGLYNSGDFLCADDASEGTRCWVLSD